MHPGGVDRDIFLLILDIETTGHGPYMSDLIQIAARGCSYNAARDNPFGTQVKIWAEFIKTSKILAPAMLNNIGKEGIVSPSCEL